MNSRATSHPTAGAIARRDLRTATIPTRLSRIAAALFGAALLVAAAGAARAFDQEAWRADRGDRGFDTWADGRLVDVQLRVDGQAAPLYFAPDRDDRRYVQAFAGRNYSVVLRNNTGRRVAVLLAVDGLNVVNGEITRLRPDEPMYVLDAYESATIRGWRTSLDEVRRFVFVDERRSYAERTGQANSDMGWIRVLSFREQLPWWQSRDEGRVRKLQGFKDEPAPMQYFGPQPRGQEESKDATPPPTAQRATPETQENFLHGDQPNAGSFPGTGWGDRRQDRVQRTQFNPEPVAVDRLILRYEYASGLQALGIIPLEGRWRDRLRDRDGEMGFARPPSR